MKSQNINTSSNGGIGILSLLTVAFVILKLCNVIDWSWWWVLSPVWIPFVLLIFISLLGGLTWIIICKYAKNKKNGKNR